MTVKELKEYLNTLDDENYITFDAYSKCLGYGTIDLRKIENKILAEFDPY